MPTIDFRYTPVWWQTSICLPDDWQKTLVGKEGTLLYDFGGRYSGFKTRVALGVAGGSQWVRQELVSPRVPIVRTLARTGAVEILQEAFAVAPPLESEDRQAPPPIVERVGGQATSPNWAAPAVPCDAAFRHIAVGYAEPVQYRFRAGGAERYTVVFGLCEGWHKEAGKRILDLQVEGKTRKTVDMVREFGPNVPAAWVRPGMTTRLSGIATEFGPMSLELKVSPDGAKATLTLDPSKRNPPARIVLHTGGWAEPSDLKAATVLPAAERIERQIVLKPQR